jgi:hypothetical protein
MDSLVYFLCTRVLLWESLKWKALIGTFMGELEMEIFIEVCMLRPKAVLETIEMTQMMEEYLSRQMGSP